MHFLIPPYIYHFGHRILVYDRVLLNVLNTTFVSQCCAAFMLPYFKRATTGYPYQRNQRTRLYCSHYLRA
jgi:hypothetical protein